MRAERAARRRSHISAMSYTLVITYTIGGRRATQRESLRVR
jgi:hypothetical protein